MTAFSQVPHLCTTYWTSRLTVPALIKTRKGMPASFHTTPDQKGEIHVKTRAGVMAILWADKRAVSLLTTTSSPRYISVHTF